MENSIKQVLLNLGLEERETKIYLTLLKEQCLPVLKISKLTNIDRTTCYDLLNKLINKGIVSSFKKNRSACFKALNANELLDHYKEKYSSLEHILPELNKISSNNKEEIQCELFQGKEGLKTPLKELIERGKDYKVINIRKEFEEIMGYLNDSGILRLNEFKAKEIAIVERHVKFKKVRKGVYRYLDSKLISPTTTVIYDNKVMFFIWSEPYFAIKIENANFAKAQEEYFSLLWKLAKK